MVNEDPSIMELYGTTEVIFRKYVRKIFATFMTDENKKEKLVNCVNGAIVELAAVLDKLEGGNVNSEKETSGEEELVCMFTSGGYCEITKTTCCNGTLQAKQRCPFWNNKS